MLQMHKLRFMALCNATPYSNVPSLRLQFRQSQSRSKTKIMNRTGTEVVNARRKIR
jgi:hypothetical protein